MFTATIIVLVGLALLLRMGVAADILELRRTRGPIERLDDYVNVLDFGALADGATNDIKAINLATKYAKDNGKNVYFPPGVYLCDNGVGASTADVNIGTGNHVTERNLLARSGQKWRLSDGATIKLTRTSNSFICPEFVSGTDYYVSGFSIDGGTIDGSWDQLNPDTTNSYGVWGRYYETKITNVHFTLFDSDAVCFYGNKNEVRSCTIDYCGRHGIALIECSDSIFTANRILNCTSTAVRMEPNNEGQAINRNIFIGNYLYGVLSCNHIATETGRANCSGNIIQGNQFIGAGLIYEDGRDLIVSDNVFTDGNITVIACSALIRGNRVVCGGAVDGIYIRNVGSEHSSIIGNVVRKTDLLGTGRGILGSASKYLIVKDNQVQKITGNGIELSSCDGCTVVGNRVNGANVGNSSGNNAGIYIDNNAISASNCVVCCNSVEDDNAVPSLYRGIHARGVFTTSVYGTNCVKNNAGAAYTGFTGFTISGANI